MKDFQKDVLDVDFTKTGVTHSRGVDASGVEATTEDPKTKEKTKTAKVKTSVLSPLGQPQAPTDDQSIITNIAGTIAPGNDTDATTKLVTWDVEFTCPWTANANTQSALEAKVKSKFLGADKVDVTLTGITPIKTQRKQSVTAQFVSSADEGAGCSCTP